MEVKYAVYSFGAKKGQSKEYNTARTHTHIAADTQSQSFYMIGKINSTHCIFSEKMTTCTTFLVYLF